MRVWPVFFTCTLFALPLWAGTALWDGSSGMFPDEVLPYSVVDTAIPEDPQLAGDELLLDTSSQRENIFYMMSGTNIAFESVTEIAFGLRLGPGASSSDARGQAAVFFTLAPFVGNALWINQGEIFLADGWMSRGPTAVVDTTSRVHDYLIRITGSAVGSMIEVFQNGLPVLTGVLFASGADNGSALRIGFGEMSILGQGASHWTYLEHNAVANLLSVVEAIVDIAPDTLNLKSKGRFVTAYIELPDGLNAEDIDIDSVALTGIGDDWLDPPLPTVGPSGIGDYDGDGMVDLMVKFDRQELISLLTVCDEEIRVSGQLLDGTPFEGSDTSFGVVGETETGTLLCDLIAYYPFAGNADDMSRHGNHGTVTGATLTTNRLGDADNAYSFDGIDDWIDVGNSLLEPHDANHELTLAAWICPFNVADDRWVLSQYRGVTGDRGRFTWGLRYGRIRYFRGGISLFSHTELTPNTWYHIATTKDAAGTITFYLNGAVDGTALLPGAFSETDTRIGGGIYNHGINYLFQGIIDDVRVYNRSLNPEEISRLWQSE